MRMAVDPVLLGLLERYVGQDVRCATFSSNTLIRQTDRAAETGAIWHVDYPYKNDQTWKPGSSEPPLGVQVLFCLDEFTACNGGTLFYTNSHTLGTPPMQPAGPWAAGSKYSSPQFLPACYYLLVSGLCVGAGMSSRQSPRTTC